MHPIGIFSACAVAVQFAFQPYLTQWYQGDMSTASFYILQEIAKIIIGVFMLTVTGALGTNLKTWSLKESLRVAFLPATGYAIQNFLIIQASRTLDGLLFNVLNQTKIIFAAINLYLLGFKTYSFIQ